MAKKREQQLSRPDSALNIVLLHQNTTTDNTVVVVASAPICAFHPLIYFDYDYF